MSNMFPLYILQTNSHRDFILVRMIGLLKWKTPLEPLCSKSRLEEFILSNLFPSNVLRIIKKRLLKLDTIIENKRPITLSHLILNYFPLFQNKEGFVEISSRE